MLKTRPRRIAVLIVLAFVVYAMVTDPTTSGHQVRNLLVILGQAIRGTFTFFGAVLGH